MSGTPAYAYRVDGADRLTSVSPDWVAFAEENGAPRLGPEHVLGRPLLDFVTGLETTHLYRLIMDRVRATGRTIVLPFRCDGPDVRRFMELTIRPVPPGGLAFEGRLVRQERRDPVALLDRDADRVGEQVTICSWCKRVDAHGDWLEVEQAVTRLKLFHAPRLPQVSHGMCVDCSTDLMRDAGVGG